MCWGLWEAMWAAGAWIREAISLFRDIVSTSGMPGAGLGAINPGERGIAEPPSSQSQVCLLRPRFCPVILQNMLDKQGVRVL